MSGPTTQEYQPLSQALQFQNQQPGLPRLQLAPPEHQKQLQSQGQTKHQQDAKQSQKQPSVSPPEQRETQATPISSSREVSPDVVVETTGQKRKSVSSKDTNPKKRKTDQVQQTASTPVHYDGIGTHYPYAYPYPTPTTLSHLPGFHPSNASSDMSFQEFQWRLLNLCSEFYEAATELLRSTPHAVLSQAFQILDRGTGLDPITVLNDARRTCDFLLANPQALSAVPPTPTALPLHALTSLARLNARAGGASVTAPPATASATAATSSSPVYSPQNSNFADSGNSKNKDKERVSNNTQGTWKEEEIQKLKTLAEKYKLPGKVIVSEEQEEEEEEEQPVEGNGEVSENEKSSKKPKTTELSEIDWDKVVEEFGDGRSRHQVLIKATYLGLKPSSSLPGKKPKKKKFAPTTTTLPPPLTFSSASAKVIPTGYNPSQLGITQLSTTTVGGTPNASPTTASQSKPTNTSASTAVNDLHKPMAAPSLVPSQHHHHTPITYGQPGWYPHPQSPYYAYQPMYYPPHPQSYGVQGYGMQPPPQGYYPPPYALAPGTENLLDKQAQMKGKRKEFRKDGTSTQEASTTPIPPPSLPPKTIPMDLTSSSKATPAATPATGGPNSVEVTSNGVSSQAISTPAAAVAGSSGVLRRGPNNSLFTYTPLPHGSGVTSAEQAKEV